MTVQEYLKEHGISEKTVEKFNITYDDNYLYLPINDEKGKLLFTKSRNLNFPDNNEPKYKNSAGSHAALFNWHEVKSSPNILLCEGEFDALRLIQGGMPATTSTGGAGTFLPEWAELFKDKNVWIVFDNDRAGRDGLRKVLDLIPHARIIILPEGIKDICEFFQTYTKKEFVQLMRTAPNKEEWESQNRPEDFNVLPLSEIVTMKFEEHPWIIDSILYNEGFCFIFGAEGTGKSFLALSIAQAASAGRDWLGHFKVRSPVNVLILDKENPMSMISKRAKGLGMCSDNIHYLKYPEKFQLADKGEYSEFAKALSAIAVEKDIGLVIIDSFVDLMLGSESSAEDTQVFFNALRELFPHKAFVALHHENKPSQGVFRSDSQRLRGSSNINAQTFTSFRLEPVAKSKTEMTLKQVKARDSLKLDKFMVRMNVGNYDDGTTYVSGFDYLGSVEEPLDEGKSNEAKDLIKEMLSDKPFISQKEIIELGSGRGISERTARRTIKEMLEEGEINKVKKGKEVWITTGMFGRKDAENEALEVFDGEVL